MSTIVAIGIYLAFAIWRAASERRERQIRETADTARDIEITRIRARLTAIEDALKSSPFITYKNN